jgi:hypothetical protein
MTVENLEEPTPNPYNMRKEWHQDLGTPNFENADGVYFESQQATQTMTPVEKKEIAKNNTNYKKRYDDLKKHYDQKLAEFKEKEEQLKVQSQPTYKPPKSLEEIEAFKKEHPDLYETVETVAHLQSQQQVEGLQAKFSAIEEREKAIAKREAENALQQRHPDFEDIRGDEKFHEWAKMQPEVIQDWIYKNPNNVTLAIKAIDLYKMEMGITNIQPTSLSTSNARETAADFVSTKTKSVDIKEPKIWTEREIKALSMRDFDKYEAEIDQAIMEGRVRP